MALWDPLGLSVNRFKSRSYEHWIALGLLGTPLGLAPMALWDPLGLFGTALGLVSEC